MDIPPSSHSNVNSSNNANGSIVDQYSGAIKLGGCSLFDNLPKDYEEIKRRIAKLIAVNLHKTRPEPPSLESRLCSIAQSRKSSSSLFYPIKAVGKAIVNLGSKIFHCLIWRSITPVRKSVVDAGGQVSFKFSQSKGKWLENMIWDSSTRNGCCWALSLNWLKHRKQASSLFHSIYGGPQKGEINPEVFEEIRALQEAGHGNQKYYKDQWLRANDMACNEVVRYGADRAVPDAQSRGFGYQKIANVDGFPQKLAEAILDPEKNSSHFKLIGVHGAKGGHALAVHIDPDSGSVTFFDPNFGEFRFSSAQSFNTWFTEQFWPKSRYGGSFIGMNQYFAVDHIAHSGEDSE